MPTPEFYVAQNQVETTSLRREVHFKGIAQCQEKLRLIEVLPAPIGRDVVCPPWGGEGSADKNGSAHSIHMAFVEA